MPVVRPWRTSTETVNAVPSGASLSATIGSRCRRRASSGASGAQTMPDVWRMMNAIFSGVHRLAATNRSPSFSRSSSSATMTISPRANAAIAVRIRWCASSISPLCPRPALSARILRKRPWQALADLAALTRIVIGDHARHHGFANGDCTDADAWIVAALGRDLGLGAVAVDGTARGQDRGRRLDGKARHHWLSGRDAAQNAAGMVGEKDRLTVVAHAHLVCVRLARELGGAEAGADLDALHRVDAHQRRGEIAVELAVDRRA